MASFYQMLPGGVQSTHSSLYYVCLFFFTYFSTLQLVSHKSNVARVSLFHSMKYTLMGSIPFFHQFKYLRLRPTMLLCTTANYPHFNRIKLITSNFHSYSLYRRAVNLLKRMVGTTSYSG